MYLCSLSSHVEDIKINTYRDPGSNNNIRVCRSRNIGLVGPSTWEGEKAYEAQDT